MCPTVSIIRKPELLTAWIIQTESVNWILRTGNPIKARTQRSQNLHMSATCEVLNEPADSKRKEGAGHPRPQRNTLNLATTIQEMDPTILTEIWTRSRLRDHLIIQTSQKRMRHMMTNLYTLMKVNLIDQRTTLRFKKGIFLTVAFIPRAKRLDLGMQCCKQGSSWYTAKSSNDKQHQ